MQPSVSEIRLVLIASTALILLLGIILVISINITRKRKIRLQQQLTEEGLKLQQAEINYQKELLEKQKTQFENQKAVEEERMRISSELHDDMGGELSAIRLLSEMNASGLDPRDQLAKISSSSGELVQKMNEIVWALNVNNDSLQSLIAYIRRYTVKYLDDVGVECSFIQPDHIPEKEIEGTSRRNIFLLVKESLNNIVKHAGATKVNVSITVSDELKIIIHDNGKGIPDEMIKNGTGNGLRNMQQRINELKGTMQIDNRNGALLQFFIPVKKDNTKGG